jgi:hypothetical protein
MTQQSPTRSVGIELKGVIHARTHQGCHYWDTSTWDQGHYIDALAFRVLPDLVAAVELLGEAANGDCAELEVVSVPSDADIYISDYDGVETIREGRVWPANRYPGWR